MNDVMIRREKFEDIYKSVKHVANELAAMGYTSDQVAIGLEAVILSSGWLPGEYMGELDARQLPLVNEVITEDKKRSN